MKPKHEPAVLATILIRGVDPGILARQLVFGKLLDFTQFTVPSPIPSTHSVFGGHVARLDDVTPANVVHQLHINVSLNRPPDRTWRRPPGRPRNKWLDQLRNDSTCPSRAVDRGHGGATRPR